MKRIKIIAAVLVSIGLAGCTFVFQTGRRSDVDKIEELNKQLDELANAKRSLEDRLSQEISDQQIKLQMKDKGLVITVVGDLLFDSGQAKIRPEAYAVLDKVAAVLQEDVAQHEVDIEGYTDNQPIRFSGWKSNWELSTARALSVLHYLVNEKGISPQRLAAKGYGEFHPLASNETRDGQQQNRRVEIVVHAAYAKAKADSAAGLKEPKENLK
jgi:chemotaxis protein MotB